MIELAKKVTGKHIPVLEADRRPGDPARLIASSDKIKSSLGWQPRYENLETILQTAWVWHQNDASMEASGGGSL